MLHKKAILSLSLKNLYHEDFKQVKVLCKAVCERAIATVVCPNYKHYHLKQNFINDTKYN